MKNFKNFSFKKLVYDKKFSIALSILIAFVFWLIIVIDQNPEREQTIRNVPISISTEGTDLEKKYGLKMVSEINQKASVKVYGPNYIVSSLKNDDIKIVANYSNVKDSGEFLIELTAVRNSKHSGYEVMSVEPSTIKVKFDYWDTKEFTIEPSIDGYKKVDNVIYENSVITNAGGNTISISGARSDMNRIKKVVAYYNTEKEITKDEQFDAELRFIDEYGHEINKEKFDYDINDVKIMVKLYKTKTFIFAPTDADMKKEEYKDYIVIEPTYTNLPNDKIKNMLNVAIVEKSQLIQVKGPAELIDNLNTIEFEEIDVLKITKYGENTFDISPKSLDSRIVFLNGFEKLTVSFNLSNFSTHPQPVDVFRFTHGGTLENGLAVSFPDKARVYVMGDQLVLTTMTSRLDSLYLVVDLTGYKEGTNTATAYLKNDASLAIMQTKPISIKVNISKIQ